MVSSRRSSPVVACTTRTWRSWTRRRTGVPVWARPTHLVQAAGDGERGQITNDGFRTSEVQPCGFSGSTPCSTTTAATLVVDGRVVAAAEEERFSRRKHG